MLKTSSEVNFIVYIIILKNMGWYIVPQTTLTKDFSKFSML